MQSAALRAISTCVSEYCTEGEYTIDVSSVSSLYVGYCSGAGFPAQAAVAATTAGVGSAATNNAGAKAMTGTGGEL